MRRRYSKIDFVLLFSWQTGDTALTPLTVAVSRQSKLGSRSKVLQVNLLPVLDNFWLFQLMLSLLLIKLSTFPRKFIHCNLVLELNIIEILYKSSSPWGSCRIVEVGLYLYCPGGLCSLLSVRTTSVGRPADTQRYAARGQDVTYCHIVTSEGDTALQLYSFMLH